MLAQAVDPHSATAATAPATEPRADLGAPAGGTGANLDPQVLQTAGSPSPHVPRDATRLAAVLKAHHAFIWRCARRFGVDAGSVDDIVQEAFIVLSRRLTEVDPGRERAFLTQTALNLAANFQRARRRRPESAELTEDNAPSPELSAEEYVDRSRTRRLLDAALDTLSPERRAVFVLSEIDGLSRNEIAELLDLTPGMVASRLRVARDHFARAAQELFTSGKPSNEVLP